MSNTEAAGCICLNHLRISYRGAQDAHARVERSRKDAQIRTAHLLVLARAQDSDFAMLTQKFTDDSSTATEGGDLGLICRGELHPDLDDAAFALSPGQVSTIVETPKGFHILLRRPIDRAQAAEIVISHDSAQRYKPRIPRSPEEARLLSAQIHKRLLAGADFEAEAVAYSDLPSHKRGGVDSVFIKGSRHPKFESIVWSLSVGGLSDVVETPTGFHIVKRLPLEAIQVRHILIKFRLPDAEHATIKRTWQEALQYAEKVHGMAIDPEQDFAALAAGHSDGPEKSLGGMVEPFSRGQMPYPFEQAAFALQAGQISKVVETRTGFHVIKRVR